MALSERMIAAEGLVLWQQSERQRKKARSREAGPGYLERTKPATWPADWPWPPRPWTVGCQCRWCSEARRAQGQSPFLQEIEGEYSRKSHESTLCICHGGGCHTPAQEEDAGKSNASRAGSSRKETIR